MLDEHEDPVATDEDEGATATADEAPAEPEADVPAEVATEEDEGATATADEAPAEAEAAGGDDDEEASIEPEVEEYINQGTTVVHTQEVDPDNPIPTEFRTPPGIPAGADPGTYADRDPGPDAPKV